jgi:8-amino-7-oxononanoate synthase
VHTFRRHDEEDLKRALARADGRPPVIVADGYCPSCSQPAPLAAYAAQARKRGGIVVIDDSQSVGIFGESAPWAPYGIGGGGSMRRAGLSGNDRIVVGASLAKAFGAPLAMLAGSAALVGEFERQSATRVHCSPPSVAAVTAAARALAINRSCGEALRVRLAWLVSRFRQGLRKLGLLGTPSLFPVQTLALPMQTAGAREIYAGLRKCGVEAVLHRMGNIEEARISFVITARHTAKQIDEGIARLSAVMADAADMKFEGSYGR